MNRERTHGVALEPLVAVIGAVDAVCTSGRQSVLRPRPGRDNTLVGMVGRKIVNSLLNKTHRRARTARGSRTRCCWRLPRKTRSKCYHERQSGTAKSESSIHACIQQSLSTPELSRALRLLRGNTPVFSVSGEPERVPHALPDHTGRIPSWPELTTRSTKSSSWCRG